MAEDDDHDTARARDAERLRQLEAKLGDRAAKEPGSRGEEHFSQANMAWRMVTELVAGLGIGFGIGFGLDYLFGTTPLLMVVFVLLGLAAGIKTMMRTAKEIGSAPGKPGDDKGE
ncbi:AtpZ/AtpI family protein [Paracoccus aestuariivivens]|uniref:ATP synthase protein I n=1 Tax=Paracoccus aestuariivivens TaxID=1820333 RepID=A0A6L6J8Z1_9RHOB|nr:AtpZ/AtpI family protein [Paracoccus aestuariivivens]MTH77219.1 F0F1 ATP synthase subunit I [Paracoccus aestuariivivens]